MLILSKRVNILIDLMKNVDVILSENPFAELKIEDFKYDDEDKAILDFFKRNKAKYDADYKKWTISKAYLDAFIDNASREPIFSIKDVYIPKEIDRAKLKSLYPKGFIPLDYQIDGEIFLLSNNLAILGDALGLGKTLTSLIALRYLYEENNNLKALIVSPLSLIESSWKPTFKAVFGSDIENFQNIRIVNYEKFRAKDKAMLINNTYDVGIFDEASRLRNSTQFRSGILKTTIKNVWLLSGELVEKDPLDIFTIVNTFYEYFDYRAFDSSFVIRKILRFGEKKINKPIGFRNLDLLRKQLSRIYLRRVKKDIKELNQVQINNETRVVQLLNEQKFKLKDIQSEIIKKSAAAGIDESAYILSMFQKTRIIINDSNYDNPDLQIKSSKYDELKHIINESGDDKLLLFTSYKITLEKLYKNLLQDGYSPTLISSDMSAKERADILLKFKTDENSKILLTSDIFSLGQNVNEASTVIHYDLPLLASVITQRIGRINRLDQTRSDVFSIVISTDSKFDRTVERILNKKLAYGAVVKGEVPNLSFNVKEMQEILKEIV